MFLYTFLYLDIKLGSFFKRLLIVGLTSAFILYTCFQIDPCQLRKYRQNQICRTGVPGKRDWFIEKMYQLQTVMRAVFLLSLMAQCHFFELHVYGRLVGEWMRLKRQGFEVTVDFDDFVDFDAFQE